MTRSIEDGAKDSDALATKDTKHRPVNVPLSLVLALYGDPTAELGAALIPQAQQKSFVAMLRRARSEAHWAGMPIQEVWEEGLSRALLDIGKSKLADRYCPSARGIDPYVNRIIGRCVRDVVIERRGHKPRPLSEDLQACGASPIANVEVQELAAKCCELLRKRRSSKNEAAMAVHHISTQNVRRHRQRKRIWKRISHLFPDMKFRPRRRDN